MFVSVIGHQLRSLLVLPEFVYYAVKIQLQTREALGNRFVLTRNLNLLTNLYRNRLGR
jgi:hypothetical protein